jgi:hypothetical protein
MLTLQPQELLCLLVELSLLLLDYDFLLGDD